MADWQCVLSLDENRAVTGGSAAALAALLVLSWLADRALPTDENTDGPVPPGTAYVLRLPGGQPRETRYAPHPRC